jgi:hypothetical protein
MHIEIISVTSRGRGAEIGKRVGNARATEELGL